MSPLAPRRYGLVNVRGCWSLYQRGMLRFLRFSWHALGGPCVSSLLFMAVFALAASRAGQEVGELPVLLFLAPGVIVFSISITAFEGAAIPLLDDKLQGIVGDFLMAPLTPLELLFGYVLPAATQALISGLLVLLLTFAFVDYSPASIILALFVASALALLFALLGALASLWADKWDHYGAAEAFLLLPLGFLSGSFFSILSLPEAWRLVLAVNPVFQAVDAFRYGLTGYAESAVWPAPLILCGLVLALAGLLWRLIARGYKLRP